ncbi:MAG: leucyl/phenylalanyl-tRNA--protein transferase [Desulforegulaceae bacterium]|nr:leucyl/phenylalanyl-tRNA--protein transferase [Desulforegulaceae bacterium]
MPVFQLTSRVSFPPPEYADKSGLLAMGGDLKPERILAAYKMGIFPWFDDSSPYLWWSPDPRAVLFIKDFHIPKSLKKTIKKQKFSVSLDRDFELVIRMCADVRIKNNQETWITEEMAEAYIKLYKAGYAHSVEVWNNNKIAGGLYGVSIGNVFYGESMFTLESDASKTGFVYLVKQLEKWEFPMIDCQVKTDNLKRFGAKEIPRRFFLTYLEELADEGNLPPGRWTFDKSLEVI